MYRLNTKIRLTMLCFSGFELYSRWVPLTAQRSHVRALPSLNLKKKRGCSQSSTCIDIFVYFLFTSCVRNTDGKTNNKCKQGANRRCY